MTWTSIPSALWSAIGQKISYEPERSVTVSEALAPWAMSSVLASTPGPEISRACVIVPRLCTTKTYVPAAKELRLKAMENSASVAVTVVALGLVVVGAGFVVVGAVVVGAGLVVGDLVVVGAAVVVGAFVVGAFVVGAFVVGAGFVVGGFVVPAALGVPRGEVTTACGRVVDVKGAADDAIADAAGEPAPDDMSIDAMLDAAADSADDAAATAEARLGAAEVAGDDAAAPLPDEPPQALTTAAMTTPPAMTPRAPVREELTTTPGDRGRSGEGDRSLSYGRGRGLVQSGIAMAP